MDNLFTDDLTFTGSAASALDATSSPNTTGLQPVVTNPTTGDLSKSVDTAGDLASILNAGAKVIGSLYPTGQKNPAAVQSTTTSPAVAAANSSKNLLLIGGGIAVLLLVVVLVAKK